MRSRPLISVITPTFERHSYLPLLYNCFKRQSFTDIEWLVMDDSALPSEFMQTLDDPRVYYEHCSERLSIGMKRNLLAERAQGEVIMHFDDDDFYGSEYVSNMISVMNASSADIAKLYGAYHYSKLHDVFAYWDYTEVFNQHMTLDFSPPKWTDALPPLAINVIGFGFSYVFKKKVWEKYNFPDQNFAEDAGFILPAMEEFSLHGVQDDRYTCLHMLHSMNTSCTFPQYRLPRFMLDYLFPDAVPHVLLTA